MDESRKQFEAEMAKLGDCVVDMRRAKNGDEEYMAWDVRLAWRFWNLSRSALNIELTPVTWRTYYPDTYEETGRAHSQSNERCARRIASEIGGYVVPVYHGNPQDCAAGIKVKE